MTDLRFALRQLLKHPSFTAVAVVTLALGIGANTAIFSLVDHVMLRLLPVRDPDELAFFERGNFSYPRFERLRDGNEVFSALFGAHTMPNMEVTVASDAPSAAVGELVSGSYFKTLGVDVTRGRALTPQDDSASAPNAVAVISDAYWKRAFGGAEDILGKTLQVRATPGSAGSGGLDIYDGAVGPPRRGALLTVVGVAPPEFFGETVGKSIDVWMPIHLEPAVMPGRPWLAKENVFWVKIMGRRRPGVNEAQATAAMTVLWRQLLTAEAGTNLTEDRKREIARETLALAPGRKGFSQLRLQFSKPLQILMAVVGMVLLIACLNVANLLLARGAARRREFGVRLAMGAGRGRLIRQLLTESLLLGVAGGALGLLVACVGTKILVELAASGAQNLQLSLLPDLRILAFTVALSLATTTLFGLAPALIDTKLGLADSLKDGARGTAGPRRGTAGKLMVSVQVAVSIVLLIGAGLFLRSLSRLQNQDVGYNPEHLVMMGLDPMSAGYRGPDVGRVCREILDRIAVLPGVRAATFSENGLFGGPESSIRVEVEDASGSVSAPDDQRARFDQVGPGYFSKIGIPLLRGRDLTARDDASAPRVAVINETMAKFYFPNTEPLGQRLRIRDGADHFRLEIVGVARDAQDHDFRSLPVRRFYVSYFQPIDGITAANFAIRADGNVGSLTALLRREVAAVNRSLMILGIRPVKSLMAQSLIQERLIASLSAFFGILALLLAAIGLYGVMAYDVAQRTNEIGVRMALGAQRGAVVGLILQNGMRLALIGVATGIAAAAGLTQLIKSQLHGVRPVDPWIYVAVSLGLIAVAALACSLPALRAARVNPMVALRNE